MQHPADDAAFDAIVLAAGDKPIFMKFSAEWCGPCQMIAGDVEALASKHQDKMVFVHIDVDELSGTAEKWQIEAMPTCIVAKNGQVQGEKVMGASMPKITALVEAHAQ